MLDLRGALDEHESKFDAFFTLFLENEFFQWARKIGNSLKKSHNLLGTHWHKIRFLVTCWVFFGPQRVWEAKKKLKIFLAWEQKKPCQVVEHIFLSNFAIRHDFPRRVYRAVEPHIGIWAVALTLSNVEIFFSTWSAEIWRARSCWMALSKSVFRLEIGPFYAKLGPI